MNNKKSHIPNKSEESLKVDKNYFKDLQDSIMAKVTGEVYHLPLGIEHPYNVPKGYLEEFENQINSASKNNLFYLPAGVSHPFIAPDGYLENLVVLTVGLPMGITQPFVASQKYFDELESSVLEKKDTFHLPKEINHPFNAPKNYFYELEANLNQKISQEANPPFTNIWVKYGKAFRIAATVIMVSLFGFGVYQNNIKKVDITEELTLAELDTEDILNYLENENLELTDFSMALDADDAIFSDSFVDDTNTESMGDLSDEELLELMDFQFENEI